MQIDLDQTKPKRRKQLLKKTCWNKKKHLQKKLPGKGGRGWKSLFKEVKKGGYPNQKKLLKAVPETPAAPETLATKYQKLGASTLPTREIRLRSKFKTGGTHKNRTTKKKEAEEGVSVKTIHFDFSKDNRNKGKGRGHYPERRASEEEVQKEVRETLKNFKGKDLKGKAAKYRRKRTATAKNPKRKWHRWKPKANCWKVTDLGLLAKGYHDECSCNLSHLCLYVLRDDGNYEPTADAET